MRDGGPHSFRFGRFELFARSRELYEDGRPTGLPVKPASVLLVLVEHRERVVLHSELMDRVWPDVAVSQSALTSAVKQVRRALGERADAPSFIETHRGRGYRFVREVEVVPQPDKAEPAPSNVAHRGVVTVVAGILRSEAGSVALDDPERWRVLTAEFQMRFASALAPRPVDAGVTAVTDDRLVVAFTDEDHAQAACRAAVAVVAGLEPFLAALPGAFSLGIGVASGEAIRLDPWGPLRGKVVSDALGAAASAHGQGVVVTESTARFVREYLHLVEHDVGFLLQGAGRKRTRLDVAMSRGLSPFVGRAGDLVQLESALDEARAGRGNVVRIVGEAGVGKSRLGKEFATRCRSLGIPVIAAWCTPQGAQVPLGAFRSLWGAQFGIRVGQDADRLGALVASQLRHLDASLADEASLVVDELTETAHGATHSPKRWRRRWVHFLRRFLAARSTQTPAVSMIDDAHWLDAASEDLLAEMALALQQTRTLLVVSHRPGYEAGWTNVGDSRRISLQPLDEPAIRDLLRALLGPDASSDPVASQLADRSGGNPFFAEELIREMAEEGALVGERGAYTVRGTIGATGIPATVRDALAARIGRLSLDQQELLRVGAVLGPRFGESLLAAASGRATLDDDLHALRSAELIALAAAWPEVEWMFLHALVREVAYASIVGTERVRLHAAVLEALQEAPPEVIDQRAPVLAQHAEEAGDYEAAAHWHRRAAERAAGRHLGVALEHWERVQVVADRIRDASRAAELGLRARIHALDSLWRTGASAVEVRARMDEGARWAERTGSPEWSAYLKQVSSSLALYNLGDVALARELAGDSLALAVERQHGGQAMVARVRLFFAEIFEGDFSFALHLWDEMRAQPRETLPEASALVGYDMEAMVEGLGAYALSPMGRLDEAERVAAAGLALAEERGSFEVKGYMVHALGEIALIRGHAEHAFEMGRPALAEAEKMESVLALVLALMNVGRAHSLCREWADAIAAFERALAVARSERVMRVNMPEILSMSSEARRGAGDLPHAEALASEALEDARRLGSRRFETDALGMLILARLLAGGREEARALLGPAWQLATELGYRCSRLRLRAARVLLAGEGAAPELQELRRESEGMGVERYVAWLSESLALPTV